MTCTSVAGNPLAKLRWFLGDRELVHETSYSTKDNYASAELEIVPRSSDNGLVLRCEASNLATEDGGQGPLVTSTVLDVEFPPEEVKIGVVPDRPRAGMNVTLICESGSSRPSSEVTWWHGGERLASSGEDEVSEAEDGGFSTTSRLTIPLTAQHHGAVVTCEASNNGQDRVHDAVTLSVNRE